MQLRNETFALSSRQEQSALLQTCKLTTISVIQVNFQPVVFVCAWSIHDWKSLAYHKMTLFANSIPFFGPRYFNRSLKFFILSNRALIGTTQQRMT